MPGSARGSWFPRYVRLSRPRRWMADIVHFGKKSHVMGGSKIINVAPVAAARRSLGVRVSWAAIMVRTVGLLAERWPEFRRSYMPFPWPRIYEHPFCVVAPVIEREWRGDPAVFVNPIPAPEHRSLDEIERYLRMLRKAPIESIGGYRRLIRIAGFPRPLRRLLLRLVFHWSGRMRTRYAGTVAVNVMISRRFLTVQSTSPLTLSVFFGIPQPNGDVSVEVFFDHRVIDGMQGVRMYKDLEATLNHEIVAELRQLAAAGLPRECAGEF